MSTRVRLVIFLIAALGLAAALGAGFAGLPSFGSSTSVYSTLASHLSVSARHATDAVAAVTFDFRGIDTLFEEFILFVAAAGVSVLLRPVADEIRALPEEEAPDRRIPAPSPTVGLLGTFLCPILVVIALETITHGQISPGGGFQGGVILASALFVVFLVTDSTAVERFQPKTRLELAEGAGAVGFVIVGAVALAFGAPYLTNIIPLGETGKLLSAGTIPVLNAVVGVEVACAFVLMASEFLDQTAVIRGVDT